MRKLLVLVILILLCCASAYAGTYTPHYNLYMPSVGESGWATSVNTNFSTLDTTLWNLQPKDTDLTDIAGLSCLANNILGKDGSNVWACLTTLNLSSSSLILPSSINLPATCTVGQIYMDTDATTGRRLYACENTNNWVQQGVSGGAETDPVVKAINGIVKSNTTTITAATAGTDYMKPATATAGVYWSNECAQTCTSGTCTVNFGTACTNGSNVVMLTLLSGANSVTIGGGSGGGRYIILIRQPASGTGTITWGTSAGTLHWMNGGGAPTLSSTSSNVDVVTFVYSGQTTTYYGGFNAY